MVLQLLLIAAFVAFFAGAMNGLSKLSTRAVTSAGAQWLGIALIASASFAAGGHTALLIAGAATVTWLVWKSAPVSGLGAVLGALFGAMSAPVHPVLGTSITATGMAATTLGMAAVICGVVFAPSRNGVIAVRKAQSLITTAVGVIRERGLDLRVLSDLKTGFADLTARKPKRIVAETVVEESNEAEAQEAHASDAAPLANETAPVDAERPAPRAKRRFNGRQKRSKRDDADRAMLDRLAGAASSNHAASTEAPTPAAASDAGGHTPDTAADDAAFDEIVKMLRNDG